MKSNDLKTGFIIQLFETSPQHIQAMSLDPRPEGSHCTWLRIRLGGLLCPHPAPGSS